MIKSPKTFVSRPPQIMFPSQNLAYDLVSDRFPREKFILTFVQGKIELTKISSQTRIHSCPLVRLDLNGAPHKNREFGAECLNPSHPIHRIIQKYVGKKVECPHVHYYVENCRDRFAFPLSELGFSGTNIQEALEKFLDVCCIERVQFYVSGTLG